MLHTSIFANGYFLLWLCELKQSPTVRTGPLPERISTVFNLYAKISASRTKRPKTTNEKIKSSSMTGFRLSQKDDSLVPDCGIG